MKYTILTACLGALVLCTASVGMAKPKKIKNEFEANAAAHFSHKPETPAAVKGYITYAMPAQEGEGSGRYVAYVFAKWGDIQNTIKAREGVTPTQWKCFITCDSSKWMSIVQEFVLRGNQRDKQGNLTKQKSKDKLRQEWNAKTLKWDSKTGKGVDQIMIRIQLNEPTGKGRLVLGDYTYEYTITPLPDGQSRFIKKQKKKKK